MTKVTVLDKIEILDSGVIQVRVALRAIDDDGTLIGQRYHRAAYPPTTRITDIPHPRVRAHASVAWTPEVIAAYQASTA